MKYKLTFFKNGRRIRIRNIPANSIADAVALVSEAFA